LPIALNPYSKQTEKALSLSLSLSLSVNQKKISRTKRWEMINKLKKCKS
jgi:hypothetical protein